MIPREVKCELCDEIVSGHNFNKLYTALVDHMKEKHPDASPTEEAS